MLSISMMNKFVKSLRKLATPSVAATTLFIASCASSTPQSRIEKNPTILESLPESEKNAVKTGNITAGMTKNAVFLAWGNPDRKFESFTEGEKLEKWSYTKLSPVYSQRFSGSFGYGHRRGFGRRRSFGRSGFRGGRFGFKGGHHGGFGIGTSVSYIPTPAASVTFKNDRVVSWHSEK